MLLEDSFAGLSGRVAPSDPLESQYDASWRVALAGAAARTGALPHFAAREAGPGTAGQLGTVTRSLPAGMFETVKRRAAGIGVEPAEYVFAVYLIVIARMTGAPGALATLRGIEGIAHPLPIFAEADPEADFAGFARSVRGLIAAARRRGPIPPAAVGALAGAAPRFGFVWREGAPKDRLWAAADAAPPQIL
ncbi:MAG: hypothetical protein KDK10_01130, partial [Maritimibacter sp.]|nr:hypothetical protein [Maritimibacter sp.]